MFFFEVLRFFVITTMALVLFVSLFIGIHAYVILRPRLKRYLKLKMAKENK